jgi:hypothetical protein
MARPQGQTECMSDQALAWKAGFGALVLVFCAASWWARKPATPPAAAKSAVSAPQPASAALPPATEPAPLDVQEDTPPVRIEVTLHDEPPAAPPLRSQVRQKVRKPAPKIARAGRFDAPRVHPVVAKRRVSPYAIGRKHYPYDPRERWALRDAP